MPQNFYELVWIFIIYAFIGWCTEVSYAALDTGKFVNRGFLNGPYCPIYGCGVVIVVAILTPLKENLFLLFLGSVLLTTALEFVTGYILEKVFHNKWWDYSDKPFNVKGYICLKFSILWGLACTFIMDVLHPVIYKMITWIPFVPGVIVVSILMCIFLVDCCITVSTILKFNKHLKIMDEMAASIHKLSDEIGENIYENITEVIEKSEKFQETHADLLEKLTETSETTKVRLAETTEATKARLAETTEARKARLAERRENLADALEEKKKEYADAREEKKRQLAELSAKYDSLFAEKNKGFYRLMKAFPDMKSRDNNASLEMYKLHFKYKNKKTWRVEDDSYNSDRENH